MRFELLLLFCSSNRNWNLHCSASYLAGSLASNTQLSRFPSIIGCHFTDNDRRIECIARLKLRSSWPMIGVGLTLLSPAFSFWYDKKPMRWALISDWKHQLFVLYLNLYLNPFPSKISRAGLNHHATHLIRVITLRLHATSQHPSFLIHPKINNRRKHKAVLWTFD